MGTFTPEGLGAPSTPAVRLRSWMLQAVHRQSRKVRSGPRVMWDGQTFAALVCLHCQDRPKKALPPTWRWFLHVRKYITETNWQIVSKLLHPIKVSSAKQCSLMAFHVTAGLCVSDLPGMAATAMVSPNGLVHLAWLGCGRSSRHSHQARRWFHVGSNVFFLLAIHWMIMFTVSRNQLANLNWHALHRYILNHQMRPGPSFIRCRQPKFWASERPCSNACSRNIQKWFQREWNKHTTALRDPLGDGLRGSWSWSLDWSWQVWWYALCDVGFRMSWPMWFVWPWLNAM